MMTTYTLPPSKLPRVGTTIFTIMSALANEYEAINLSQGFPNFRGSARLNELVFEAMQKGQNQYAPMAGLPALKSALQQKIQRMYGVQVDATDEITVTAGATQALFTAITAFVRPGDEVILIEPAYDSYAPSIEVNGGVPVPYALKAPDYRVDWEAVATLVTPRTRMLIVNTPHNPTGRILRAADLLALQQLVADTDILVLSDEVYEHLIYDEAQHESVLKYESLRQRSFAVYSFGKTFHNTGWKVGYCVAPAHLMAEFRKVHQFNVFSVNTPMQHALAEFLQDPGTYEQLPAFYQAKRDFFLQELTGSSLRPLPCEGTYFLTVDYSAVSALPDTEFAKWMTKEMKVAVIPVSVFYSTPPDSRVVRLCFAKTEEVLGAAGKILRGV